MGFVSNVNVKKTLLLISLVVLSSCTMAKNGALIQASKALEQQRYEKALSKINEAMYYSKGASKESQLELLIMKARVFEAKGDADTANGIYAYLYKKHPDSKEGYIAQQKLGRLLREHPDKYTVIVDENCQLGAAI